jgi:hypothetical protein
LAGLVACSDPVLFPDRLSHDIGHPPWDQPDC